MANYVSADSIVAQSSLISFGETLIRKDARFTHVNLGYNFAVDSAGITCGAQTILVAPNANVGAIGLCADHAILSSCAQTLDGAQETSSVAFARTIAQYCAQSHEIARPLVADTVRAHTLAIAAPISDPVTFAGPCQLSAQIAPIVTDIAATITLPDASAGTVCEYFAHPLYNLLIVARDVTYRVSEQAVTFVSDGTQWYALDSLGRKYVD
jgi:hypothetical protein